MKQNWIIAAMVSMAALGCTALMDAPGAHEEALAVAAEAETARMQAAIDKTCAHLRGQAELECALNVLAKLQPNRWEPEDIERGHKAARQIGSPM